jgi:hypothetical protein
MDKGNLYDLKTIYKQIVDSILPKGDIVGPKAFLVVFPRRYGKTHLLQDILQECVNRHFVCFSMFTQSEDIEFFEECVGTSSWLLVDNIEHNNIHHNIQLYIDCVLKRNGFVVCTTSDPLVDKKGFTKIILEDNVDADGYHHYNFSIKETRTEF